MRTSIWLALLASLGLFACSRQTSTDPAHMADVVLLGGVVSTMNPSQPTAEALAIKDGRIAYVGASVDARKWVGPKTEVVELRGVTVLPGFIDTHIHVMESALVRDDCAFEDTDVTLEQAEPVILECANRTPGTGWVHVQNLNAAGFKADRRALDGILAERPVFLWSADGHVGWGNSAALKTAGVTRNTPDPADGRIGRDAKGEPTGFLVDGALSFVSAQLETPSPEKRERILRQILPELHAAGITAYMEANTSAETVETYVDLARKGALTAKVNIALATEGELTDAELLRLKRVRDLAQSQRRLRVDTLKLFADGVMEYPTQTAAMLQPYLDAKGRSTKDCGRLYYEPQQMADFVKRADQEGFNVHVHAIGDRAVRTTLDAFAAARAAGSKRTYSIAHLQLIDPADLPRFRELNVFASVQLLWAEPDNYSVDAILPYIGAERQSRIYPGRSLVAAGATIVGGSDWSVTGFNPLEAMATAISRTNPREPGRGVLDIREALKLHEMFEAYTINAARMLGRAADIGSLQTGKSADLIVLDRRLDDSTPADEVRSAKVTHTFIDGRPQNEALPPR